LKLCDFGLARGVSGDLEEGDLTEYVVTRWYRAPEIMLSCPTYDSKIDIWSIACIFAEMMDKKPLFPGDDYIHQLTIIIEFTGRPTERELYFVTNPRARRFVMKLDSKPPASLQDRYRSLPASGIDLLENLLFIDPNARYSVKQALNHPYFVEVRDRECERPANFHIDWDAIEKSELTKPNLRALLLRDFDVVRREKLEGKR